MFVRCLLQRPSQCHGSVSVDESETGRRPKGHDRRLMTITVLWRYSGRSYVRRFRPERSSIRMTHIDVPHLTQMGTCIGSSERGCVFFCDASTNKFSMHDATSATQHLRRKDHPTLRRRFTSQ